MRSEIIALVDTIRELPAKTALAWPATSSFVPFHLATARTISQQCAFASDLARKIGGQRLVAAVSRTNSAARYPEYHPCETGSN
jgi:hypothetical protein